MDEYPENSGNYRLSFLHKLFQRSENLIDFNVRNAAKLVILPDTSRGPGGIVKAWAAFQIPAHHSIIGFPRIDIVGIRIGKDGDNRKL